MTITPELQETITAIAIQAVEQHRQEQQRSRTMYQRICEDCAEKFACCEYDPPIPYATHRDMRSKVRGAIGTLLITAYQADRTARLPADKEEDIREFVQDVLALVVKHQQKNAPSGATNT